MKNKTLLFFALLVLTLTFSACGGPKKCNGSRGTATDMGTM